MRATKNWLLLFGFFPGWGKNRRSHTKKQACLRTLCRTPAHPFSPTIKEVTEADNALWEGGSRWNNKQRLDDCSSQEGWSTTITHTSWITKGYFALDERQNIWSRGATRTSFRTVVRKIRRINSCTCLREYIHNVSFSDKYLIAKFYFKFNQSPFPAHPSRTLGLPSFMTKCRRSNRLIRTIISTYVHAYVEIIVQIRRL